MKTLVLLLMIGLSVAGILYCRVNLGMSWADISTSLEDMLPRMLSILVVLAGLVVTIACINRKRPE